MRRSARSLFILAVLVLAMASTGAVGQTDSVAAVHPAAKVRSPAIQPVLGWLGVVDLDRLESRKAGGITLGTLEAAGIAGNVVMLQQARSSVPDWMVTEWKRARRHGMLFVGVYIAAPLPKDWDSFRRRLQVVADAAKRAGANGLVFDAEPYGYSDTAWDSSAPADRATMRMNAQSLAPIIKSVGDLLIYPSSNASFPGSYNDVIRALNGDEDTYAQNLFPDFVDGLLAGGVQITLTDASFQFGPQRPGDTWATGIAKSVALTTARFPGIRASAMLWPDSRESHGAFSPAEMQTAFSAAARVSTGPVFLYQQSLANGSDVKAWRAWLAAIKAALATK